MVTKHFCEEIRERGGECSGDDKGWGGGFRPLSSELSENNHVIPDKGEEPGTEGDKIYGRGADRGEERFMCVEVGDAGLGRKESETLRPLAP